MFGAYRLVSRLARGGMAETWLAERVGARGVTKRLIIKRVLPNLTDNEKFINSFINEARLSTTLSHGNIAQVFDFGEVNGEYFLAMEYVHGPPLAKLMKRAREEGFPRIPVPIAIFITMKMLEGLHYAHTRIDDDGHPIGVVHRDVSPENVMVSFEGEVKVIDFGIAKSSMEGRNDTEAGVVKGKYHYFSPEQAMAEDLDGRSDVFAVGEVLYTMLCGRVPFDGPLQVSLRKLIQGKYPKPRLLNPDVTPALEAIIVKSLEKDRQARYLTARAMQEALGRYLFGNAPGFSSDDLRAFVQSLYRDEMKRTGRTVELTKDQLARLSMWKSDALKLTPAPGEHLTESEEEQDDAAARDPSTAEGTGHRSTGTQTRTVNRWALAAVGVATVLTLGATLYAIGVGERSDAREVDPRLAMDEKPIVPKPPRLPGAVKAPVPVETVETVDDTEVDAGPPPAVVQSVAAWPQSHLEVLASEHATMLVERAVPAQALDGGTFTVTEVVGAGAPPLYFALEDTTGRVFEAGRFVGGRGAHGTGVGRVFVFSPRALPPSTGLAAYEAYRNILFDGPVSGTWKTLKDAPVLETVTAATFTKLAPRATYKLTLGKAVGLEGVAPLLLCGGVLDFNEDAPREISPAQVEGAWRVLKPGSSATFSGVRTLGCGFLDAAKKADNRGSVSMDLVLVAGESTTQDPCEKALIALETDKLTEAETYARVCFARSANGLPAKKLLANVLARNGKDLEATRLRGQMAAAKTRTRGEDVLSLGTLAGESPSMDRMRRAEARLRVRDFPRAQLLFDVCIQRKDDYSCRCERGMGDALLGMGMVREAGEHFEKFALCWGELSPEGKKYAQLAARYGNAPR